VRFQAADLAIAPSRLRRRATFMQKASALGSSFHVRLGLIHAEGKTVPLDYTAARRGTRKPSRKLRVRDAELAALYENGLEVPKTRGSTSFLSGSRPNCGRPGEHDQGREFTKPGLAFGKTLPKRSAGTKEARPGDPAP